jgi:SAM-dependent methyltransferase
MNTYSTFSGYRLVATGDLRTVISATKALLDALSAPGGGEEPILIFDHAKGRQVDFDFRGNLEDVIARALPPADEAPPAKAGKGRPKLGVVSAEVTLLPRHWEWLASQPTKASGTIRRLVEDARAKEGTDPKRRAEALGNLLWSLGGNLPDFENATRALYALDAARLFSITDAWPGDLPSFVRNWFSPAARVSAASGEAGAAPTAARLALMEDLYRDAPRQGPGGDDQTARALELAVAAGAAVGPGARIADLGCGTGAQTLALAGLTGADIDAVDILPSFLERLAERARKAGCGERIRPLRASMAELPFADGEFDAIWAEGSIYNLGFREGLSAWRRFLKSGGVICASELSWFGATRPVELEAYWKREYPGVDTVAAKLRIAEECGYVPVGYFPLPGRCWTEGYYRPLEGLIDPFLSRHGGGAEAKSVAEELRTERALYERYGNHYGYGFYVLKKR